MCRILRVVGAALVLTAANAVCGWAQELKAPRPESNPFGEPLVVKKSTAQVPQTPTLPASAAKQISTLGTTAAEERIRRELLEKTTLNFTDAKLGEVVAHLKREHNIEIQLDKEALEQLDLGSDTLVTCAVKDISLRSALNLLLDPLELTYIIKDDVLLITSKEVEDENRATVVYDVADLVTYRDEKGESWTDYEPLINVLTATVAPDSWTEMGGNGTIEGYDFNTARVIIVKQTGEIQAEVAGILKAIRAVAAWTPGDGRPPLRPRPKTPPMPRKRPPIVGHAAGIPGPGGAVPGGSKPDGSGNNPEPPFGGM